MLNNKYLIIIISIVLVISIGVTVALVVINKEGTPDPPDVTDDPIISDTPIIPDKPSQIPVFLGNADLSDERTALLDGGILAEIERLKTGAPKEDGEGNYLTDEHGILIFESSYVSSLSLLAVRQSEFISAAVILWERKRSLGSVCSEPHLLRHSALSDITECMRSRSQKRGYEVRS